MVYVHLAEGFEEIEALTVVDVLRRADIDVQTVSVTGDTAVTGTHGIEVKSDVLFEDADYDSCDMLVFPGGMPGAENLKKHKGVYEVIEDFAKDGRKMAAICAAPIVFCGHEALKGKKVTVYPGFEEKLEDFNTVSIGIVEDENILTGKGPAFAVRFALTIVQLLKGKGTAGEIAGGMLFERF